MIDVTGVARVVETGGQGAGQTQAVIDLAGPQVGKEQRLLRTDCRRSGGGVWLRRAFERFAGWKLCVTSDRHFQSHPGRRAGGLGRREAWPAGVPENVPFRKRFYLPENRALSR